MLLFMGKSRSQSLEEESLLLRSRVSLHGEFWSGPSCHLLLELLGPAVHERSPPSERSKVALKASLGERK